MSRLQIFSGERMRARIRDFLETEDGWIFAVADYIHPDGIRSILRYVPDLAGERVASGRRYRKMDFDDAFAFLRRARPEYVRDVHVVPVEDVKRIVEPSAEIRSAASRDPRVGRIVSFLEDGGVSIEKMGITGSILVGLNGPSSDIDFVVYGDAWWRARDVLAQAKADGRIAELDLPMWRRIYSKRKPDIPFEEFVLHESRKGNRGMIDGTYFDLLFTRDWEQIEPRPAGIPKGRRRITARVSEARYSYDAPAIFKLDHEVGEILCYSHTYAGQALLGETVEAAGVLEETCNGLRLVVGTTREARGEWIRSLTLLEEHGLNETSSARGSAR